VLINYAQYQNRKRRIIVIIEGLVAPLVISVFLAQILPIALSEGLHEKISSWRGVIQLSLTFPKKFHVLT